MNLVIQKVGATLVSYTESIDETPSGILLHGIMSSITEFYSANLANEVKKGSLQKAKTGGTVGKAPTGATSTSARLRTAVRSELSRSTRCEARS
ncbi:MAG: recombinase family protein [bacterium]|nr:recombinase family protein [bacterium]MCP5030290.1 recombinase family protein [Actinomycetes bacterium]